MATDRAYEQPGEMGWGVPYLTEDEWNDEEARTRDYLASVVPQRLARGEAKTPNLELLSKVLDIQKSNGIESGFWFSCLEAAVFGKQLQYKAQRIGSCVASGDMRATGSRMLAEVYLLNDPESLPGIDIEGRDSLVFWAPYNYRAGRKIAGIRGSDGSLCVPHITGKMRYGHLPCSTGGLESDAFPEPVDTNLYRRWGNSDQLLEKFAPVAKKYPLLESEKVKSEDDVAELITKHYKPCNICSSWSFVPDHQHPSWTYASGEKVWIYKRGSRPWHHNMTLSGHAIVNGREYDYVRNSWGLSAHKNGDGFWIPSSLTDDWLRQAQCQSVGEIDLTDNESVWPDD